MNTNVFAAAGPFVSVATGTAVADTFARLFFEPLGLPGLRRFVALVNILGLQFSH